ncbi:MAG: TRAP transporter large permease subunit [Geminicoccaceae bacterium]|nr:TRAP transporter large permease subunit [Geminicoccaceae bacterium]MCX7629407.1 TRAP transporter large permease subunit [Geminicoccaceae bacterium]MDW8124993.1 TRAP transporter large permease subunit [Geminicoccaceae bacterium]
MHLVDLLPLAMFASVALLLFTGYPVAFVLGGSALAFGFVGTLFDVFKPIEFFNLLPRIWGGIAENLVLVAVPLFVFMGTMLERSDVAADLLRALQILLRRVPGGLALAVTLMGTIMAATTGIIGASVVMLTMMALPVMLERRYSHELATGTIAAAGTLGILIPPSIMLVIMADLLSISVGNLFFGAVFPGLLLSGLYLCYIAVFAALRPAVAPPLATSAPPAGELLILLLKSFFPPVFLIVLVLGSIFAGWATPTEAAGVGAAGTILLAALKGRLDLRTLVEVCERTGLTCAMIFFIFIGATAFSYVFRSLGGDYVVEDLIRASGLDSWGILVLIMVIVFLLGFFFDWVEITLIVLPIFAPLLKTLDFGTHVAKPEIVYWFAILLAVNLQTSFLTPPFGFALFYMKGICPPEVRLAEIYRGIVPFVALQLAGLALCILFPEIVLWLPRAMLD